MARSNDDSFSSKKSISRKKLVDLKAVQALLDDRDEDEGDNVRRIKSKAKYQPNEELIQATARIKSQRDLILSRVARMETHRDRVTQNVYKKVRRDYTMQLQNITKLLNEKKDILNKELKRLYMLREKLTVEATRHREILEEAQFRQFLEEFSEEQFKEVEEFESKEITNFKEELSQVSSYISVHEELFDPEDLGLPPKQKAPEVTKTIPPLTAPPPPPVKAPEPVARKVEPKAKKAEPMPEEDPFSEKTPIPEVKKEELKPTDNLLNSPEEYFEPGEIEEPSKTTETKLPEPPEKHTDKEISKPQPVKPKGDDPESIFDVLEEDIPLDESKPEPAAHTSSVTPSPSSAASSPARGINTQYKLIFTETETTLDVKEYPVKDNMSIGRSPSNDIVLDAPKVSRQHAAINKYKDQYLIIDLKSSNGVFINGVKVDEQAINEGDEISVGGYKMIFKKS